MQCIEEERYEDAQVIGKEILPFLANESLSVRLRIYHLLRRHLGLPLSDAHLWNARGVAEDIMADHKRTPEERIRAHILYINLLLGSLPLGASPPERSTVDPQRRWLSQELRELYAEEASTELLGRGGEGDTELHRDAHIVRCFTCLDHRSVEAHLEALFADGDQNSIVQGCCGASAEFHQETACKFLNRALASVTQEKAIAPLLEYKLRVLLGLHMLGPWEKTQESEECYKAFYRDFVATMARLELCGDALLERAHGHLCFSILADWYEEEALAEIHCDIAKALAEHLQNPGFQQFVERYREWLLGEGTDEAQGGDDEGEEKYDDEDDDDDDDDEDDDEEDFWQNT